LSSWLISTISIPGHDDELAAQHFRSLRLFASFPIARLYLPDGLAFFARCGENLNSFAIHGDAEI